MGEPEGVGPKTLQTWHKLGPFDIMPLVNEGLIGKDLDVALWPDDTPTTTYSGQINCLNQKWGVCRVVYKREDKIHEGFRKNGFCRIIYRDGSYYQGELKNSRRHGQGKYFDGETM